jgi:hypothetical protein
VSRRIFLLSPASCSGKRAQLLLRSEAEFDLACRVRGEGARLAEVFGFLSGLYFRGKVAYAARFAQPPDGVAGAYCITTNRGLLPLDAILTQRDLRSFDAVDIEARNPEYTRPLKETGSALAGRLPGNTEVVLLGSVATQKYASVLRPVFGARLRYPKIFAGLGDMSRGSLMLRAVREEQELEYVALDALAP